jgi:hypothetical protein
MMIIHANVFLKTNFGKLNHHYFGWVEDAQGFVFLSGLVVGLVYGGRFLRHGYGVMRKAVWARIRTIYSYQILLLLIFLTAALIFVGLEKNPPPNLVPYANNPVTFTSLSAMLLTGSTHMGILPMYIFFLILTPLALRLLNQKRYKLYLAISVAGWAIGQTRLSDLLIKSTEKYMSKYPYADDLGIFFNIFGWQILFFGGLMIGFLMAAKRLQADFLEGEEMRWIFLLCGALFFFYGIYDRIIFGDRFGVDFSETIKSETDRGNFSTIYLIAFIVDLLIVVWLLGPGKTDENRLIRGIAHLLHRFVSFRPFVFLGQHSLQVFSVHILVIYVLEAIFQKRSPGEFLGTFVILLCIGCLYFAAWLNSKSTARKNSSLQLEK